MSLKTPALVREALLGLCAKSLRHAVTMCVIASTLCWAGPRATQELYFGNLDLAFKENYSTLCTHTQFKYIFVPRRFTRVGYATQTAIESS